MSVIPFEARAAAIRGLAADLGLPAHPDLADLVEALDRLETEVHIARQRLLESIEIGHSHYQAAQRVLPGLRPLAAAGPAMILLLERLR